MTHPLIIVYDLVHVASSVVSLLLKVEIHLATPVIGEHSFVSMEPPADGSKLFDLTMVW